MHEADFAWFTYGFFLRGWAEIWKRCFMWCSCLRIRKCFGCSSMTLHFPLAIQLLANTWIWYWIMNWNGISSSLKSWSTLLVWYLLQASKQAVKCKVLLDYYTYAYIVNYCMVWNCIGVLICTWLYVPFTQTDWAK